MTDPWRLRCPKGHASVTVYSDTYLCEACDETYDGEPFDAKRTEFPVDEEPLPKAVHDEVLAELVRRCEDDNTSRLLARRLHPGRSRQIGAILAELAQDGLVEKLGCGSPNGYKWRPTEAGRRHVLDTEREIALSQPRRERAQIDPICGGAAVLFAGLIFVLALAITHGVGL